jgi:hypothetical protein
VGGAIAIAVTRGVRGAFAVSGGGSAVGGGDFAVGGAIVAGGATITASGATITAGGAIAVAVARGVRGAFAVGGGGAVAIAADVGAAAPRSRPLFDERLLEPLLCAREPRG